MKIYNVHVSHKEQGKTVRREMLHIFAEDGDAARNQIAQMLDARGNGLDCEITMITERHMLSRIDVARIAKRLQAENPGIELYLDGEKVE